MNRLPSVFLFWSTLLVLFGAFIYVFSGIFLPFILGSAVAYFLNPAVCRMESWGLGRITSSTLGIFLFLGIFSLSLLVLIPFLKDQLLSLGTNFPFYMKKILTHIHHVIGDRFVPLGIDPQKTLKTIASNQISHVFSWGARTFAGLFSNTLALANILSLLFLTPVIAFYMLRDWSKMGHFLTNLIPIRFQKLVKEQVSLVNKNLSAYLQGQSLVCIFLVIYYVVFLTLIGLNYSFTLGLMSGLFAFIPYLGFMMGLFASLAVALGQSVHYDLLWFVFSIYMSGQIIESYFLTPRLIGDRVGLHPVWIIFGLLGGGIIGGFLGILMALPSMAILTVIIRFLIKMYRKSQYYLGGEVSM
jgi:predicted PurR-regulated permease PerM